MKAKLERLMILIVMFVMGLTAGVTNAKLIAHWRLDEKTGNVATDSSGNHNAGVLNGEVIWAPAEGRFDGAARFGKTEGDYIEILFAELKASHGTVSLWINIDPEPGPARTRFIFGHSKSPHWSNRLQLYLPVGDSYEDHRLNLGLGDSHTRFTSIKSFRTGRWYHIALTWGHGDYVVYVDGLPEVSGAYTGFDQFNSVADIGNDGRNDGSGRNESFKGLIDEVVVFDHALNEREIMQLYNGADDCFASETFLMLLDNIERTEQSSRTESPLQVVSFIEKKIAEYNKWKEENPNEINPAFERLSCEQYFLLAKAKEAAKAPVEELVEAYKQSVSQLQFRPNYVPALLWLHKNIAADDFIDTVKKSVRNVNGTIDNLYRIAMDFESSKNWDAFELYLDAVFSEINNSESFAAAMAAGLRKNGSWAKNFSRYVRNKPQLGRYYFEVREKRALEKMAQEDFSEAAEIYRDITDQCKSEKDKAAYKFKACECIFEGGEYNRALSELDDLISDKSYVDEDLFAKAMLMKGRIFIQLGEINRASETFSRLVKEHPQTPHVPEAVFFIGYCYMLQGKYKQAAEAMDLVIKNYPRSSFANKAHLCIARMKELKD
jgi:TolA-binding protein